MFEEFANQYGAQIVYMIVSAILAAVGTFVGYVANRIRKKYEDNINSGEKKTLIDYAVQYAEQCCAGHGEEKYEFALSAATALLNEKGIPFTETELKS